jgi:hypothetical protein
VFYKVLICLENKLCRLLIVGGIAFTALTQEQVHIIGTNRTMFQSGVYPFGKVFAFVTNVLGSNLSTDRGFEINFWHFCA